MNPNTSRSSAMRVRWRTRAATFCALVCSVFLVGNGSAETSEVNINAYPYWEEAWRTFYQQWQQWFVERYGRELEAWLQANPDIQTGTITNFLGQVDWDEFKESLALQFSQTLGENADAWFQYWASLESWFVYAGSTTPYIAVGTVPMANDGMPLFDGDFEQSMGAFWVYDARPDFERWFSALSGSSNGVGSATTNLLTTQNLTLERVAEYVAGVSNAVGTISNEYETEPTGSNDFPIEETPDALQVERSVDMSSLEEAVQQTFDGLDGLTPTGSSKVPEIVIQEAYRGNDPIKVRLDLSEIGIATRVCKACWAILLAVGVLGIVRSEWDYWTTLGGSAT